MSKKEKPYNNGNWTEARFNSFIKGGLRQMSLRWPPIHSVKKKARVKRGYYLCAECGQVVPASYRGEDGKRHSNVHVDHIKSVVDTRTGFTSWDDVVERLFVEEDGLQILCHDCHKIKTQEEREERKEFRQYQTQFKREYNTWKSMLARCYNENHDAYDRYGGRGIYVCDEWRTDFFSFYEDMGERPEEHSLDRLDNNKGYSKNNCKWSTRKEQANNKHNNIYLVLDGKEHTLSEWSDILGLPKSTISGRLGRGWSVEKTLKTKPGEVREKRKSKLNDVQLNEIYLGVKSGKPYSYYADKFDYHPDSIRKLYYKERDRRL